MGGCTVAELDRCMVAEWHPPQWHPPQRHPPEAPTTVAHRFWSRSLVLYRSRSFIKYGTQCGEISTTLAETQSSVSSVGVQSKGSFIVFLVIKMSFPMVWNPCQKSLVYACHLLFDGHLLFRGHMVFEC